MSTQTSPNMTLVLPVVGSELGPAWANELFTALYSIVDQHNHTAGKGVLIPSAALNINADLPYAGFNATGLRTVRLNLQGANPALGADINCVYSGPTGDLWYNTNAGTQVQITQGGVVKSASALSGPAVGTERNISAAYTIDSTTPDYELQVDASGGSFTITLPIPTLGRQLVINDAKGSFQTHPITLSPHSVEKICGLATSKTLTAAWSKWFISSNGTDWFAQSA